MTHTSINTSLRTSPIKEISSFKILVIVQQHVRQLQISMGYAQSRGYSLGHRIVLCYLDGMVLVQQCNNTSTKNPEENLAQLQQMYQTWPFFKSLLENADMVLSKSNMDIAKQYSNLCEDEETRSVFDRIEAEWQLTKKVLLQIEKHTELIQDFTCIKRKLRLSSSLLRYLKLYSN